MKTETKALRSPMSIDEFKKQLTELTNTSFDCGEWPDDQVLTKGYRDLVDKSHEIRDRLVEAYETVCSVEK